LLQAFGASRKMTGNPIIARCEARFPMGEINFFDCVHVVMFGMIVSMSNKNRAEMQRKISIHVLLRLTAMDVCCGPPQR